MWPIGQSLHYRTFRALDGATQDDVISVNVWRMTVREQEIGKRRYFDWFNKEADVVTGVNVHTCCNGQHAHLMVQQLFSSVSMYHRSHLGQIFVVQIETGFSHVSGYVQPLTLILAVMLSEPSFYKVVLRKTCETGSCKLAEGVLFNRTFLNNHWCS